MIRVFLAFDISEEVKKSLSHFMEPLRRQSSGVKWVEPQNIHVTVKFFGNVDEEKILPAIQKTIEENCGDGKPVTLTCEGIGCFPSWQRPRVIWAGLKGGVQDLMDLQRRLEGSFETLGFPKEDRDFKTHLTLARIKFLPKERGWLKTLEAMPERVFGKVVIDHLTLYKSQLTKRGPIYTSLKEFPFKNQP